MFLKVVEQAWINFRVQLWMTIIKKKINIYILFLFIGFKNIYIIRFNDINYPSDKTIVQKKLIH